MIRKLFARQKSRKITSTVNQGLFLENEFLKIVNKIPFNIIFVTQIRP